MSERAAVVTGSSSGIGRACALHLDRRGFRVFAGVRDPAAGESLAAEASDRLTVVRLDVTKPDEIERVAAQVTAEVDTAGLTGLVNNAGGFQGGPMELVALDDLRAHLELNLVAQVAVTQALLPALRAAHGRIVFMTSIGGRVATPFGGPYNAAKFGLEAIADCMRVELAPFGVKVALIEPGSVDTEIWRKGQEQGAQTLADFDEHEHELYGEGIRALAAASADTAARGIPPERVAETVEHALTARRPRTRYLVGRDARGMLAARRVLGDRGYDRLVRRVMRLP